MMKNSSHTLPSDVENNKLDLTDIDAINYMEAVGIAEAKAYSFKLDQNVKIDVNLLKDLHRIAFGKLYHWAGKIRKTQTNIGVPPYQILERLKVFLDNLDYRLHFINPADEEEVISLLTEVHHIIVYIHPFVNGNGRIARLFTNLISLKLMHPPFEIYVRDNVSKSKTRENYIKAIKKADEGDYAELKELVRNAIRYSIEQYEKMDNE
ncbi:MAG: Fic/DOC family protein [Spirochaetota bacterium]